MKARVFVSCGQNTQDAEVEFAREVGKLFEKLGYDPYIAISEQTLRGVKENIFARLAESEYFLFIDFKRDLLPTGKHRGSLFSHQELSIAAYLEKPLIAFQEQGIGLEGVLAFVQGNCTMFSKRDELMSLITERISTRWTPDWRDQIKITRVANQFADEAHGHPRFPMGRPVRYFHLEVRNDHCLKTAFDCYAYLEHIRDIKTGKPVDIKMVEYKWRGVTFPNVIIPYKSSRELDAFFVYSDEPSQIYFGTFSDSPKHIHKLLQAGDYELTFAVHSQNFGYTSSTFRLHIGGASVSDINFG